MLQQVKELPISEHDKPFIEALENQAAQKQMTLGVFGSFSVGKSALINALIGQQNLLPTHTNETTAIPTYIQGGEQDRIVAQYYNGTSTELSVIKLHSLTAGGAVNDIERIVIERSAPSWLKEITFIDTPGRNTKFKAHIDASEQALITSDAALYIMPWQGLTLEDIVYLKHILRYQPNLYFVINKVDRIDETQGISIEDMQARVKVELNEHLDKDFPVFAVSAKTGYNIEKFYVDFILPLKTKIAELKEHRLNYALQQYLAREKERVLLQIALYEQALKTDGTDFTLQKQDVQIQYENAQIALTEQIHNLREMMENTESEMQQFVQKCYEKLEIKLKTIAKEKLSIDELTLKIENEILTTRNKIFEALHGRIQKIIGTNHGFTLASPADASIKFNMTTVNLATLQAQYEHEREKTFAKIEAARLQLETVPEQPGDEATRERLLNEIAALTEQAMEKFVPQYIYDETFDPNKSEKIASAIGFVGDMALTVGLAVATAGTSAAAQVGGKVAAKEAAKAAAKKATIEVAEKAIITGVAAATGKSDSSNNDNTMLKAAKALDKFTSPVQTVAQKIGQQIDATRTQPKKEDIQHRRQFFEHKLNLETERDNKLRQLEALEKQASTNERVKKELTLKRAQVEKTMSQKLTELEQNYVKETERLQEEHVNKELHTQLQQILLEEEQYLNLWFKNEFENVVNAAEQLLPEQLNEQLRQIELQLTEIEQFKTNDLAKLQKLIEENRAYVATLDLISGEQNEILQ